MSDSTLLRLWIDGPPAAFAGGEPERRWRQTLQSALEPHAPDPAARGLRVSFALPPPAPGRPGADLDNLLDPLLSVLVNRVGWFSGRRPAIDFIWATKSAADRPGCELELLRRPPGSPIGEPVLIDDLYEGPPPLSARDESLAAWVREHLVAPPPGGSFGVALRFGDPPVNLGDAATGRAKPVIDCLWPALGGTPGAPHDHLVRELRLSRDATLAGVQIALWSRVEASG